MFGWAIALAIVALIAAILGFSGVAGALANVALVIFVVALLATVIFFVLGFRAAKTADERLRQGSARSDRTPPR